MNRLIVIIITCLICFGYTEYRISKIVSYNDSLQTTINNKQNRNIGIIHRNIETLLCDLFVSEECKELREGKI